MAFLLNYGEFYERLRDLLENNHPVSKYKFGNKVNGAMKDFDAFLENTVKKYMDAYNATQFIKAENVELRVLIDRLKKEIKELNIEEDFLRLQLEEKDAICQQIISQRQKMQERLQYSIKDNPVRMELQRVKVLVGELKEENSALRLEMQVQKSRIQGKQKQMAEERAILEEELNKCMLRCQKLEQQYQLQLNEVHNSIELKLHSERKIIEEQYSSMQEMLKGKVEALKREVGVLKGEMEAMCKKKEWWKQKYYEQVGFVALTEDNDENKSCSI